MIAPATSGLGRERPLRDTLASGGFRVHSGRSWLSGVLVRASAPLPLERHHHSADHTGDQARTGSTGPDVTALHYSTQRLLLRILRSRVYPVFHQD
jgi:hypothetical protein